jgi:hypothetical protein
MSVRKGQAYEVHTSEKRKWSVPSGRDTNMSRVGQVVLTNRCKAGEQNLQVKQSPRGSARVFCASVGIWHEMK